MKDLLKIYRRFILTAATICILIIIFNLVLLLFFLWQQFGYKSKDDYASYRINVLSSQLTQKEGQYKLSPEAQKQIDAHYAFAMLISPEGQVVWSRNLPPDIPRSYSLMEVASFTRWYLKDYPVKVQTRPDGLFVAAFPRHSLWKYTMEFKEELLYNLPPNLLLLLLCNLLLIFGLAMLFGRRFYASLRPLTEGIQKLTGEKVLTLPQQGFVGELAKKLNQASAILIFQRKALEKRDNARTNWIAGVSHDIRTPLSLIMAYGDHLSRSPHLNPEEQKEAASIRENSLLIKHLISDLNLTSRLEYDSYPLQQKAYAPAALLRSLTAAYLNDGLEAPWDLELSLDPHLERVTLTGDPDLLLRAFRNLINNSIQHNPTGCQIRIQGDLAVQGVRLTFSDTGVGIPVRVIKALYRAQNTEKDTSFPHVMGLRIVKQILEAHGGRVEFLLQGENCHSVVITLPVSRLSPNPP